MSGRSQGDAALEVHEIPWRRDAAALARHLGAWAQHAVADDAEITQVRTPESTGMSSETVLFTLCRARQGEPQRYVARLAPDPSMAPVFPDYDLELQRRCMETVARHTTVPVPRAPWYEPDPSWLGSPFLVMEHVDGAAPPDIPPYVFGGWLAEMSVADRARFQSEAVGILVRLHELVPERVDLRFLERPQHGSTPLDQHLGYQRWYYEWAREGVRCPLVEALFEWVEARRPDEGPTVLNWGDARIGNILWRQTQPVAVLDWEMAALGPAEIDVAWMVWMHRFFQDLAQRHGFAGIPGLLERAEVVAAYEAASGRQLRDVEWYEAFAALRHAVITVRTSGRSVRFGQQPMPSDPDDLLYFRPLLEQMLDGTYWR